MLFDYIRRNIGIRLRPYYLILFDIRHDLEGRERVTVDSYRGVTWAKD